MIPVVLAATAGLLVSGGLWAMTSGMFAVEPLERTNYRGAVISTGVGTLIPLTVMVVVAAAHVALLSAERDEQWFQLGTTAVLAATAFGLLGLLDDVAGAGQSGGFRQHLSAITRGELTSGALKMLAGGAAGILVASAVSPAGGGAVATIRDGATIALAANLANLFDRAPGRCIKFSVLAFGVAAVVSRSEDVAGPAVGVGAALALLVPDLREKMMLGDAGSNPLGALVGLGWLVAVPGVEGRWLLLGAVLILNGASEVVSYSSVIDRVGPLRWFDRLGSQRN